MVKSCFHVASHASTARSKTTQASAVGLPPFRRVAFEPRLARVREPRRHIQVVAGPRQVCTSTLVRQVAAEAGLGVHLASADEPEIQKISAWSEVVKRLVGQGRPHRVRPPRGHPEGVHPLTESAVSGTIPSRSSLEEVDDVLAPKVRSSGRDRQQFP